MPQPVQQQSASADPVQPDSAPQLLVSIRDAEEARMALEEGVHWIDLKEPARGALGTPPIETAFQVAQVLQNHSQRSVALGEFTELVEAHALQLAHHFPVLKIGLSGLRMGIRKPATRRRLFELADAFRPLGARLVPVIYADWQASDAPRPDEVFRIANELASEYILVDTFHKDGRCLLDHLSLGDLRQLISISQASGCRAILAGSLRFSQLEPLLLLPIAAIGVRGGVCDTGRDGPISRRKLQLWMSGFTLP